MDYKYSRLDDFIIVKTLGKGGFGKVKLGLSQIDNKYYALKIIKAGVSVKEAEIMKKLNHPNIIRMLEFKEKGEYQKINGTLYKVDYLVLELATEGELYRYLQYTGKLNEEVARTYFHQLIDALEYCHEKGIAHRDLNLGNLLLNEDYRLKLADFGFSTLLDRKLSTNLGSENFKAPEFHKKSAYEGPVIDLFAAGVILFVLCSGRGPFQKADVEIDKNYRIFCDKKRNALYWKFFERSCCFKPQESLKELLTAMLSLEPSERLSIKDIKKNEWYNGPTIEKSDIVKEFNDISKKLKENLEKEMLDKQLKKQAKIEGEEQKSALHFVGLKKFRSLGELNSQEQLEYTIESLKSKYPEFDSNYRALKDSYVAAIKINEFVSFADLKHLYSSLIVLAEQNFNKVLLNARNYKISMRDSLNYGEDLEIEVKIGRRKDDIFSIQILKNNGSYFDFYEVVKTFRSFEYLEGKRLLIEIN